MIDQVDGAIGRDIIGRFGALTLQILYSRRLYSVEGRDVVGKIVSIPEQRP